MTITYLQAGEHSIPNLTIPPQPKWNKYALMRKQYLKEHRPSQYTSLLLTGKLSQHLSEAGERTQQRIDFVMAQLAEQTPAPRPGETLANTAYRNNLLRWAEELILPETIFG